LADLPLTWRLCGLLQATRSRRRVGQARNGRRQAAFLPRSRLYDDIKGELNEYKVTPSTMQLKRWWGGQGKKAPTIPRRSGS
jgi:hypothetical protein